MIRRGPSLSKAERHSASLLSRELANRRVRGLSRPAPVKYEHPTGPSSINSERDARQSTSRSLPGLGRPGDDLGVCPSPARSGSYAELGFCCAQTISLKLSAKALGGGQDQRRGGRKARRGPSGRRCVGGFALSFSRLSERLGDSAHRPSLFRLFGSLFRSVGSGAGNLF